MGFKSKDPKPGEGGAVEEKMNTSDFSQIVHKLTRSEFGVQMHERLVKETQIVKNEKAVFDMTDINRVLGNYPSLYGWAIVEAELIAAEHSRIKDEFEEWYAGIYNHVAGEIGGKPTVKAIESKVTEAYKDAQREWKERVREIETKTNIARGMVKVWSNAISSLQSLSGNMKMEFKMLENNLTE